MICASLCLSQPDCIGFEMLENGVCNRIEFIWKIEEVDEDSAFAKMLWMSVTLTKKENFPEVDCKISACVFRDLIIFSHL